MKKFIGVFAYEYRMSISRKAVLIVTGIFALAYLLIFMFTSDAPESAFTDPWADAGSMAFGMNIFFPVVAGIIASDRAVRDSKLGVRELLRVTNLDNYTYILGKYFGVAFSLLTLQFAILVVLAVAAILIYGISPLFLPFLLVGSIIINAPGLFFITAFSLACPLVMPVRVYQILFTGYWYWGNFLNPEFIPTIANTLLNAAGKYAAGAYFGFAFGAGAIPPDRALANIAVLLVCAALALVVMERYITWRENAA